MAEAKRSVKFIFPLDERSGILSYMDCPLCMSSLLSRISVCSNVRCEDGPMMRLIPQYVGHVLCINGMAGEASRGLVRPG